MSAGSNALSLDLLVVEDDPIAADLIIDSLSRLGARHKHVATCRDAYHTLGRREFSCLVVDLKLPDGTGYDIRDSLLRQGNPPPVVFITADDHAERAIASLNAGVTQVVIKRPAYLEHLNDAVASAVGRLSESEENSGTANAPIEFLATPTESQTPPVAPLIGSSWQMQDVRERILRCANTNVSVVITGETGTGKELVARAIHDASPRAGLPFVAVNCAAISGSLFESELFGSTRGAFTGAVRDRAGLFEAAGQGTLLLDEIGELSLDSQAKLLRVLEDRSYRRVGDTRESRSGARIITATNRDLSMEVEKGTFRSDLYYRLDVMNIHLSALRERLADVPELVAHFLRADSPIGEQRFAAERALESLRVHPWPGNVRELRHVVSRTLAWSDDVEIKFFDLGSKRPSASAIHNRWGLDWNVVAASLRDHGGKLGPTASSLNVSVRTLQRRMHDLGINPREFR